MKLYDNISRDQTLVIAVAASLALHAAVVAAIFIGWQSAPAPKRVVMPNYVEAKLVELKPKTKKKASAKKKPKKIDLTAKRREQEILKKEQEAKKIAQQLADKEAKRLAEAEKKKLEQEQQLAKERQEQERRQKQKQLIQQEFDEALAEEEGMLLEDEYATEAQSYANSMKQRIEQNWNRPPSARTGMICEILIQLVPTGRVVSANVVVSSGNAAFDRSAIQAIKKVDTFPEVKEMAPEVFERYYRSFRFRFDPQDLRQ